MKAKYKNKEEQLIQMYQNDKLSLSQIAQKLDVGKGTVGKWLKRFGIPARSSSVGRHIRTCNHCDLSKKAIEWINGELLGDGCIKSQSKYSACFSYSSKHKEYIKYVSDTLLSFGIKQTGNILIEHHKDWGNTSYSYISKHYIELLPIRKKWYPFDKKIVPKGIKLNPLTCRQWYMGDGCIQYYGPNGKANIKLCTNGFTIIDVNRLINKLQNLGFKSTRQPSRNIINISAYSVSAFLNYIGECPAECYAYKW